ncbi:hypothetical protein DFH09DRAFT_1330437 [Mycena vulgaris]|nr:hypothetical protein DFH09DRAFT_1330437 [Mycena vulgaris]
MSGIDHRARRSSPLALAPRSLVRALGVVSSNGKFDSPAMLSAEHGLRSLIMEPGECEKWQKIPTLSWRTEWKQQHHPKWKVSEAIITAMATWLTVEAVLS